MKYDQSKASNSFLKQAEYAEYELNDLRPKCVKSKVYADQFDDRLAKFYVYNYLHGKLFLDTRLQLLRELREMAHWTNTAPREANDPENFERFRQFYTSDLIKRYETEFEGL